QWNCLVCDICRRRPGAKLHQGGDAAALGATALSRQVSDLEDQLGVDLLKRTSHRVVVTAEGRLFLEAARGVDIQTIWADCIQRRKNRSLITNEPLSRSITSLASSASTAR